MSLAQKLERSGKTLAGPRKLKRKELTHVLASPSREVRWNLPSRQGSKGRKLAKGLPVRPAHPSSHVGKVIWGAL